MTLAPSTPMMAAAAAAPIPLPAAAAAGGEQQPRRQPAPQPAPQQEALTGLNERNTMIHIAAINARMDRMDEINARIDTINNNNNHIHNKDNNNDDEEDERVGDEETSSSSSGHGASRRTSNHAPSDSVIPTGAAIASRHFHNSNLQSIIQQQPPPSQPDGPTSTKKDPPGVSLDGRAVAHAKCSTTLGDEDDDEAENNHATWYTSFWNRMKKPVAGKCVLHDQNQTNGTHPHCPPAATTTGARSLCVSSGEDDQKQPGKGNGKNKKKVVARSSPPLGDMGQKPAVPPAAPKKNG
jgi:hypothetical protein